MVSGCPRTARIERAAIFRVEVPLPAQRLLALHQHLMAFTLPSIEPLHAPFALAGCPLCEFFRRTQEVPVDATRMGNTDLVQHLRQRNIELIFAGLHPANALRSQRAQVLAKCLGERGCRMPTQLAVVHGPAFLSQRLRKVTHRR